jgi:hypothetical protein
MKYLYAFKIVPSNCNYIRYILLEATFFASLLVYTFQAMLFQHQDCKDQDKLTFGVA